MSNYLSCSLASLAAAFTACASALAIVSALVLSRHLSLLIEALSNALSSLYDCVLAGRPRLRFAGGSEASVGAVCVVDCVCAARLRDCEAREFGGLGEGEASRCTKDGGAVAVESDILAYVALVMEVDIPLGDDGRVICSKPVS